jgi:choline dehydrogenase
MLAERASDLVRGRNMLPASDAPVGLVQDWENSQRSTLPGRNVRV